MNTENSTTPTTDQTTDSIREESTEMSTMTETADPTETPFSPQEKGAHHEMSTMTETADPTPAAVAEEAIVTGEEAIVPLPEGLLACRFCGVATSPRPPLHWAVAEEWGGAVARERQRPVARHEIPLTVCPDCAELTARTAELLEKHPGLTATRGPALAEPLALGVVVAHRLLGLDLPAATIPDAEFSGLVRAYGHGAAGCWERAVQTRPKDLNRAAASTPWSAVPPELLARLRAARAGLIAERLAETRPPHRIAPPALAQSQLDRGPAYPHRLPVDGGCAWCGVSTVELSAVEVHRLGGPTEAALARWRPILRDQFAGHLCPACADALDSEGAHGQTAVEGALIASLGLGRRHLYLADDLTLDGVGPWCDTVLRAHAAGRPAPAPSRSPWAHVGDLDGLRAEIARVLGVAQ